MLPNFRFALRKLRKSPGSTMIAAGTLALGIGATSAILTLVQGVLLTPPPYPKPDRLFLISSAKEHTSQAYGQSSAVQWSGWQEQAKSFDAIVGYQWVFDYLVLRDGSRYMSGLEVAPTYFRAIGVGPVLGREFLPSDYVASAAPVVILSHDVWQRQFQGDSNIIGKSIHVGKTDSPLTIVGIMPAGMRSLPSPDDAGDPNYDINAPVDYWVPISSARPKKARTWNVIGRLHEGTTREQAEAELNVIAVQQAHADKALEGMRIRVQSLVAVLNRDARRVLLPLLGGVVLVFLIACVNVAGVLLAHGLQRQHEYAIRCALGAKRFHLFGQVLTETMSLCLVGGLMGVGLATAAVKLLKISAGFAIPRLDTVSIGWSVVFFCLGGAVIAAGLAGFMPALRAAQMKPVEGMKSGGQTSSTNRKERRLLGKVAILQIGLTLCLVVNAGLMMRTAFNLARVQPEFSSQNILTMSVTLPNMEEAMWEFHIQALPRITALSGVQYAAFVWGLPLTGNKWTQTVRIEGQPQMLKDSELPVIAVRSATPDYFNAMGLKLVEGRNFRSADTLDAWKAAAAKPLPGEPARVVIINQSMARRYFPNGSPIGKKLYTGPWINRPCEVIGVVTDSRNQDLNQEPEPEVYQCFWQCPVFTKHLIVRTESDPRPLISVIQSELRAVNPVVAIEKIKTMKQIRSDSIAGQTFAMRLLGSFSVAAMVLSLVGIYGVMSLSVSGRQREIAIRLAVGAQRRDILFLVLREGLVLIAIGTVIGAFAAVASSRILRSLLFGVGPDDLATFSTTILLFGFVGLLACYVPARRATRVDSTQVLKAE